VEILKVASLAQAAALPTNIRLSWKGLPGTNTVAYYENSLIIAIKSLLVQAPVKRMNLMLSVECKVMLTLPLSKTFSKSSF
jgi:hypothetical protein